MRLLEKEGSIYHRDIGQKQTSSVKVVFLGDIMVLKSGQPPKLSDDLKKVLENANIIVANVESPVVNARTSKKGDFH